jgi:DedD protein
MDRALKERVIGAVVLVIIAVLIVPIFLDGRSGDVENVQESITLPGQTGAGIEQKTVVLQRDREQPVPAPRKGDKPRNTTPTPQPAKVAEKPKADTPSVAKSAPTTSSGGTAAAPQSSTGMWAVQLGSFSDQANAERLAAGLRKEGYAAFLSQLKTDSGKLHRVRVGPQKDRAAAEAIARKLAKKGHKGQVVPHP